MSSEEISQIISCLGRGSQLDGEVRGSHLGKILMYLKITNTENLDITLSKLALVLGMNPRYVRENYLKGLMYFGVIKIYEKQHNTFWKWVGIEAFKNGENLATIEEMDNISKRKEPKKEHIIKDVCLNCGKETTNKKFCDEKCLSDYYLKKRNSE